MVYNVKLRVSVRGVDTFYLTLSIEAANAKAAIAAAELEPVATVELCSVTESGKALIEDAKIEKV